MGKWIYFGAGQTELDDNACPFRRKPDSAWQFRPAVREKRAEVSDPALLFLGRGRCLQSKRKRAQFTVRAFLAGVCVCGGVEVSGTRLDLCLSALLPAASQRKASRAKQAPSGSAGSCLYEKTQERQRWLRSNRIPVDLKASAACRGIPVFPAS